jgi:hypothetical protein
VQKEQHHVRKVTAIGKSNSNKEKSNSNKERKIIMGDD